MATTARVQYGVTVYLHEQNSNRWVSNYPALKTCNYATASGGSASVSTLMRAFEGSGNAIALQIRDANGQVPTLPGGVPAPVLYGDSVSIWVPTYNQYLTGFCGKGYLSSQLETWVLKSAQSNETTGQPIMAFLMSFFNVGQIANALALVANSKGESLRVSDATLKITMNNNVWQLVLAVDPNCAPPSNPCPANQTCVSGVCWNNCGSGLPACPSGQTCGAQSVCGACSATAPCPVGQHCITSTGVCAAGCLIDANCIGGPNPYCVNGACVACVTADNCSRGEVCIGNQCYAACGASNPCPAGQACVAGVCGPCKSDADCGTGKFCNNGQCQQGCGASSECATGQICLNNVCVCSTNAGCPAGQYCSQNTCLNGCATNADCAPGQQCVGGTCVQPCTRDSNCAAGYYCQSGTCVQEVACGASGICPSGFVCSGELCVPLRSRIILISAVVGAALLVLVVVLAVVSGRRSR